MKIVICDQCGRALHETKKCFHCGSTSMHPGAFTAEIPGEAAESFAKMEQLLSQRKFAEVISLSRNVRQWMGACAEYYWLRLLAKMECATDLELILRGADLDNDEDYGNAGKYAAPEEYQVYVAVQEKMEWLRMELNGAVRRIYRQRREALHLAQTLKEQEEKNSEIQLNMHQHWSELLIRENRIRQLDMNARLVAAEHRQSLKHALELSDDAAKEASRLAECSESQYQALMMRLTAALQMSEEAAAMIRSMKDQHPWLEAYNKEKDALRETVAKIEGCLESLKKLNQKARSVREQLTKLETEQESMRQTLRSGDFRGVRKLLGKDWDQVLEDAQILV